MNGKKRIFIIVGFCLLLVITGTVNVLLNNYAFNAKKVDSNVVAGNFFTNFRTKRTSTREDQLLYLNALMQSSASSPEAKLNAEEMYNEIVRNMSLEDVIEAGIIGAGFPEAVILISSGNISVLVKSAVLTEGEVAKIVSIVQGATNIFDDIETINVQPIA